MGERLSTAVIGFLGPVVLAGLVMTGIAPIAASASTCESWGPQPPDVGTGGNQLAGVATTSPCNAWAVGDYFNGSALQTLVLHWNGTAWKRQTSPDPGGASSANGLYGVAAISSTNAWAVGYYANGTAFRTLVLHWNGSKWTVVKSPDQGGSSALNVLRAVTATSSTNAWAVGLFSDGVQYQTLALHWNGTAWKHVTSPNKGGSSTDNELYSVAAASASSTWAVGRYSDGITDQTLVLHWNGSAWQHVTSPNLGGTSVYNVLWAVTASSSTNAWAVGEADSGVSGQTLVEHWNGTAWRHVTSPNPAGFTMFSLHGVVATSSTNAWAVGEDNNGTAFQTLVEHWNGTAWTVQSSPDPGGSSHDNALVGVAASSSSNAWAVGDYSNGVVGQSLAIQYR